MPALLQALARITAEKRDTSRDARMAILDATRGSRLAAGARQNAPAVPDRISIRRSRARAAAMSARPGRKRPRRRAAAARRPPVSLARSTRCATARLRFVMAGRGPFELRLLVDEAPVTALRVATRAREGYYNGLTFHRVAPNFVIQGGSPGANEYMRRWPVHARRGRPARRIAAGPSAFRPAAATPATRRSSSISSILPRLDHTYTVFAEVVSGMDVVDAIIEGDVIERVEVVPASRLTRGHDFISRRIADDISSRLPSDLTVNATTRSARRAAASAASRSIDLTESNPTRVGLRVSGRLLTPLASPEALVYDPQPLGLAAAREAVAEEFARRGHAVAPERIALTASTSEAYALLFKLLCDAGDNGARATAELSALRTSHPCSSRS